MAINKWHRLSPQTAATGGICLWAVLPPYVDAHWEHVLWAMIGAAVVYVNRLIVS